MSRSFVDSNILIYAFSTDIRAERAQSVLHAASDVGVQTLNEFANVSLRKAGREWAEISRHLCELAVLFPDPVPLDITVHNDGVRLARRYGFSIWDSMMVAAALRRGCELIWSEDLQHGQVLDDRLLVANPFLPI